MLYKFLNYNKNNNLKYFNILNQTITSTRINYFNNTSLLNNVSSNNVTSSILPRQKHRIPQKRASKLLNELKNEEFSKLKNGRQWPYIRSGDAVEIKRLENKSSTQPQIIRGVVIGIINRSSDSSLLVLNHEFGTPVLRRIIMYNPLIIDIRVLQQSFIHGGKKRTRRSKLYYLQHLDPERYTVKYTNDDASFGIKK